MTCVNKKKKKRKTFVIVLFSENKNIYGIITYGIKLYIIYGIK